MSSSDNINIFPRPSVPLSPVLSLHSLGHCSPKIHSTSILDCKNYIQVTSGRAAIALALEHAGVEEGDEVLLPAFHCESMVAPVHFLCAKPVFFRVCDDASINCQDIADKITSRTKVILVTHYFGFLQELDSVAALCRSNGIILIEDCAHTFFVGQGGIPVGKCGDYAVASSMKFFPVYDGGVLASEFHDITTIDLEPAPLAFELKSFFRLLELSIEYKKFGFLGLFFKFLVNAKDILWRLLKGSSELERSAKRSPASSNGGYGLDEDWIRVKASLFSKAIMRCSDTGRITERRRSNYLRLDSALGDLENCHPLFKSLPPHVIPLVYPLCVDNPNDVFEPLKMLGVPIWRFGEFLDVAVTPELCGNSVDLSKNAFQFPCHQELTDDELTWMIENITEVMLASANV